MNLQSQLIIGGLIFLLGLAAHVRLSGMNGADFIDFAAKIAARIVQAIAQPTPR